MAAVMFLFLHDVRNSMIVLISIPASLIASILAMWAFDFSLNLMTLLALSLVVGILVDDSIVVLENIHHHLEQGQSRADAALRGRNEIGFAALSITLVDVVVFVPLSLVAGLVGDIMREFAIVIVISTLMSLFVSFTLTPMLASRFSMVKHATAQTLAGRVAIWFEKTFLRMTELYIRVLQFSLKNAFRVLLGMTLLFVASLLLPVFGLIGSEFMKQSDQGQFIVKLELPPGSTLENTNKPTQHVEGIIASFPEVKKVFTSVGLSSEGINTGYKAELTVTLVDRYERSRSTGELANDIKQRTRQIPGTKVRFTLQHTEENRTTWAIFGELGAISESDLGRIAGAEVERRYNQWLAIVDRLLADARASGLVRSDLPGPVQVAFLTGAVIGFCRSWVTGSAVAGELVAQTFLPRDLGPRALSHTAYEVLKLEHQRLGSWDIDPLDQVLLAIAKRSRMVRDVLGNRASVYADALVEQVGLDVRPKCRQWQR